MDKEITADAHNANIAGKVKLIYTPIGPKHGENVAYDMGFKAGIKEVVEWINGNIECLAVGQDLQDCAGNSNKYGQHSHIYIRYLEWQAKLKEWEIENE